MVTATTAKKKPKIKVNGVEMLNDLPPWSDLARVAPDLSMPGLRVSPAELVLSPTNPRRALNPEKVREIAVSIREHGWFGTVLARRVPGAPGFEPRLELVFGNTRRAAALLAGVEFVGVELRDLTDLQVARLQMAENMARGDLHPLEEAAGFAAMIALGDTVEEIAAHVGRPASFVRSRLQLQHLAALAREAFDAGHFGVGHADVLAALQHADQERVLAEHNLLGKGEEWEEVPTVRDLQIIVRDEILLDLARAPWELADAGLVPDAGACSACPKRSGATPDLFPGVQDDRCADSTCFGRKRATFLEHQKARAAARAPKDVPVLEVSTDFAGYGAKPKAGDPLTRDAWKPVGDVRCSSAQPAVVVRGDVDVGKEVEVCSDPKCVLHFGKGKGAAAAASPEEKAAAKAARAEEKLKAEATVIACTAIARKVREEGDLGDDDLRMVARGFWRALWRDVKKTWAGWRDAEGDHEEAFKDAIKGKDYDLEALLVELALAQFVEHGLDHETEIDELKLAAKRHSVNPKSVMADAKAALTPPAKEEAKSPTKGKKKPAAKVGRS